MFRFVLLCFIFSILYQTSCSLDGGAWRHFVNGSIPADAFVAGQDNNGRNIYVGLAFMNDGYRGLGFARIYDGVEEVEVFWGTKGIITKNQFIYILCGPQENFKWLSTDAAHLNQDLLGKRTVSGGFMFDRIGASYDYIGRISIGAATYTGYIVRRAGEDPKLDFILNGVLNHVEYYEVLYYDDS